MVYRSVLTVAATCVALATGLTWRDCSEHRQTDAVSINNIEASPNTIVFPGDLHLNLNLTFKRNVSQAYLDIDMYKLIFGFPLHIPCLHGTVVGSCRNVDACRIFRSILRDPNHPGDYGHQAESIMLAALGHYMQCPILAEDVLVNDAVVKLDPVEDMLHVLTDGDYSVTLRGKEVVDGPYTLGCIQVNGTIGRGPTDTGALG